MSASVDSPGPEPVADGPSAFVTDCLGAHSSHPAMAPVRLAFWRRAGLAVAGAAVGFAGFAVYRAFAWEKAPLGGLLSGLRQAIRSTDLILFSLAAALSAVLAAALTVRVSRLGTETSQRPFGRAVLGTTALALAAALMAACVAFGWLSTTNSIEFVSRNRWWVALAAALPLEALLIYVEVRERRQDSSPMAWAMSILRQLWFAASVSATAIVMMPSMSRALGNGIGGWLKDPSGFLGGMLRLLPGADVLMRLGASIVGKQLGGFVSSALSLALAVSTVAWVSTKVARIASDGYARPAQRPARRGTISRLLSLLNPLSWFRRGEGATDQDAPGEDAAAGTGGAPSWMGRIAAALEDCAKGAVRVGNVAAIDPADFRDSPDYSALSDESHLEILFDGRPPTEDQVAALRLIDERWFHHSRALLSAGFGPAEQSHADVLIQAFPESFGDPDDDGVLELQVASAMLAVVSRGQRVVFLVSGEEERSRVLSSVQSRLEALRIETLYRASSMAPTEIARWAPPAAAPGTVMDERPPDVMVATLADYEQAFFGGANSPHVIRALLFDSEVVMLPNLLSLTRAAEGRLHLPFILDKHRLILASENRSMQLVVGSPPIGERPVLGRDPRSGGGDGAEPEVHVALEAIALRLFGGDSRLAGHSAILRRRIKSFPARVVVRVPGSTVDPCIDAVAALVAEAEGAERVCVVLGREDPRPSDRRLAALSVGKARIPVIHELDCADVIELVERVREHPFVVVQGRPGGRLVREIGSRLGHDAATIVEVTSGPASVPFATPSWSLTLPVFPSADSPALALAHLRSAAFQLGSNALIRRDEFVRFGIGWNRSRWRAAGGFSALHEGWAIELDGCAAPAFSATEDQGEIWPAAIVRSDVRKERPVLMPAPPERGLGLSGDDVLSLAQDGFLPDPGRGATWIGPRGQILGRIDLAYANRFIWTTDRQEFRAVSAERSDEHGWIIHGHPFHGEEDEPELPVVELSICMPASAMGLPVQVRQGENVCVFAVRDDGGEERCMSLERVAGLVSRGNTSEWRDGTIDAASVTAFGPLEYSVRVGLSFVCMGSRSWLGAIRASSVGAAGVPGLQAWMSGEWSVGSREAAGREFSPAFTAAVQRSVLSVAPGVLDFARVAAFRLEGADDGVVILFVEPHATAGTAAEAMRVVLDDPALRRRFVGRLLEAIVAEDAEPLAAAPLFMASPDPGRAERDRAWAARLIQGIPGSVIDLGAPIGAISRDAGAALPDRPEFSPSEVAADGKVHTWKWAADPAGIGLAVEIGIGQAVADEATQSFGCSPGEGDPDRLRRCGIRTYEGNRIGPDYSWMIRRSEATLKPLAARLLEVAQRAGASTARDRVEVFASFVQSLRYVRDAQGRFNDGKIRMGVQMPAETLYSRCGDCDSLSILLVGLVRAAGLARSCVVLIDEVDGGHALAAFEIEPRSRKDWAVHVRARGGGSGSLTFTVMETTALGWRAGMVADEYRGRYVRLEAVG